VIAHREAEPADIDDLVAVVLAAIDTYRDWRPATWQPPDPARHAAHWRRQFGARMLDSQAQALVAHEPDRRPVGVVGFTQARDADQQPVPGVGHIWVLFVTPGCWRRGLGSDLLHGAEAAMRERGYASVILSTPTGSPACRFYEARGFSRDGRSGWYAPGELALVGYAKALG
jgi:ribosomal protein S18 acetylase RimI-like enzyme